MEYPVTLKAQEMLKVNKISLEQLKKKEPLNGKKYSVSDVFAIIDQINEPSLPEAKEVGEFIVVKEVKEEVQKIEPKVKAKATTPMDESKNLQTESLTLPDTLEYYWDDRKEAERLEKEGSYVITEVRGIPNANYGRHKLLILKRKVDRKWL
jgi:hypothetical protein